MSEEASAAVEPLKTTITRKASGPSQKAEMNAEGAKTNFHIPESNASDVAPSECSSYRGKTTKALDCCLHFPRALLDDKHLFCHSLELFLHLSKTKSRKWLWFLWIFEKWRNLNFFQRKQRLDRDRNRAMSWNFWLRNHAMQVIAQYAYYSVLNVSDVLL